MGNSEVGHLNIGAGRVVMQDLPRISDAIARRDRRAPALHGLIARCKQSGGTCHLIGLVSPAACIRTRTTPRRWRKSSPTPACRRGARLTDGRDTPPQSAGDDLEALRRALPPSVPIATVIGRYYAMDRDKRWERVARPMTPSSRPRAALSRRAAAIADAYAKQQFDEFVCRP
jgi:2,3-bisphosphoglycerate-independent phosphoglycerate mutase